MIVYAFLMMLAAGTAAGTTVTVQRDGLPVDRAEICRFRAGDRENPFQRWLTSQELTCADAGAPVTFPAGLWNVFARTGNAVSVAPLLVDGDSPPATISLTLEPAAVLELLLPPGHGGAVYAPSHGVAFPAAKGTARLSVPAGTELWLFVVEKSLPVAVLPIGPIAAGTVRTADARSGGPSCVMGWLEVPETDRAALETSRGLLPPSVRMTSGAATRESDPLPPLTRLHGAFIRVGNVPEGDYELSIGGRGWIPQRHRLQVSPGVTVAAQPLSVRGAGSVVVHWSVADDVAALERSLGTCDPPEKTSQFELTISACPPQRPGERTNPSACTVIRQETFAPHMRFGSLAVENVAPGVYRGELRFGKLPPVGGTGTVRALHVADIRVLASFHEVYGSVTRGGKPLGEDAAIEFPGGYGFASRESGEYRAALTGVIGIDAPITVAACDGAPHAVVLTDLPIRRNARYNLDIPDNRLTVTVTDTFTRQTLEGATVRFTAMSTRLPRRPVLTRTVITDADARVVFTAVPDREIRISASHAGYQKQDVEPFSITRSEEKALDVQLVPLRGNRGRILSERPFESGAVFWYSPSGAETERAELADDGTFVYAHSHDAGETMAVVSLSHPLWVFRAPAIERRQTISLRFPAAPVREFDVTVAGTDRGEGRHIGIAIGGVVAPQPALAQHQFLRGQTAVSRGPDPLRFRDLAETGPIEAILGPTVDEVLTRHRGMSLFDLPPYAGAPRQRLMPGAAAITFR